MGVLVSNDSQGEDGVRVSISSQGALLNRRLLLSDVPLNNVSRQRCSDNNIRLERIEHRLGHLVVAVESHLGPSLEAGREDVDHAIWLVVAVLCALAVADQQQLTYLWTPVDRSDCSLEVLVWLKHELLGDFLPLIVLLQMIVVIVGEEVADNVEVIVEGPLHNPGGLIEELFEDLALHLFLGLLLAEDLEGILELLFLAFGFLLFGLNLDWSHIMLHEASSGA